MNETERMIGDYAVGPDELESAVKGLTEAELDQRWGEEGWSIREIVHHLAEADTRHTFFARIALIKSGHEFEFSWHPGNSVMADMLGHSRLPIEFSLALFRANRAHFSAILRALPLPWENYLAVRVSPGEVAREVTVREWVRGMQSHLEEHLAEISHIRNRLAEQEGN